MIMEQLSKIDSQIEKYRGDHFGESPLYILLPADEIEKVREEIRKREGYSEEVVVTTFKGIKILPNESLKSGELRLTNELPETGS